MTPGQNSLKTVLELDLAAYSDIARVLEEHLDVQAVKHFQDQIQSFVDEGLNQLSIRREDVVFATAGDNALLIFDDAAVMHKFAKFVQEAALKHNRTKSVESAKRWFRMGAATGPVLIIAEERRIVGTTVIRAVRLEAAAEKGELLVDAETYNALPEELQKHYGAEEIIAGKRDELFTVRRCAFISPADRSGKLKGIAKQNEPDKNLKKSNFGRLLFILSLIAALVLVVAVMKMSESTQKQVSHLPAAIALVGMIIIVVVGYREWKRQQHAPRQNAALDEKSRAYHELWGRLEDIHIRLRTSERKTSRFSQMIRDVNVFVMKNGLYIDEADRVLANRYLEAVFEFTASVRESGDRDAKKLLPLTTMMPPEVLDRAEQIGLAQKKVQAVRDEIIRRFRKVIKIDKP